MCGQRGDDLGAEGGQRLGRGEVAEPDVDPLDAALFEAGVVLYELGTGADDRARVAEPAQCRLGDGPAVGLSGTYATICWIETWTSPTCERASSSLSRMPTWTFHQSANSRTSRSVFGPAPPMRIGISRERHRRLHRAAEVVELAVVVEGLPGPQRPEDLQRLPQPLHPRAWFGGLDARRWRSRRATIPSRCRVRSAHPRHGRAIPPRGRGPPDVERRRTARATRR